MSETLITQLQNQLDTLTEQRRQVIVAAHDQITKAQERITQANREYDERAVPIMRQLNQLRPPETAPPRTRPQAEPNLEGLSDEDQAHYLELLRRTQ